MTEPRVLTQNIAFGESARWHDGRLWICDWGAQEILAIEETGHSEVVVRVDFPSFPMCIAFTPAGCLQIVSSRDGRLLTHHDDGTLSPVADLSAISDKPWNDLVIDGRGNAYINNIGFEFPGGEFAPGVIALVGPDGSARQVADKLAFPNGMAITPDNRTLIVAESYANRLTAFNIAGDGELTDRRVWADCADDHPDGICVDADAAVWYADVGNNHCVRVLEGGHVLNTVELDRGCFDCALGGTDQSTLFVVAQRWAAEAQEGERSGQLVAIPAPAPAAGWP